jgi:hypothetical protein
MWYLVSGIILLGILTAISTFFDDRRRRSSAGNETEATGHTAAPAECCGRHEVCERDIRLAAASNHIEYYDDEELDAYRGTAPDRYNEKEVEEFREVLYTLREAEVAGWMHSLQFRGVNLPEQLKDEALLIMEERRKAAD